MAVNKISNATIEEISKDRNNTLVTVVYRDRRNNRGEEQRIRMVAGPATVVVKMDGTRGTEADLSVGMVVNAILSIQATRSNPPQSEAFFIEIVKGGTETQTTVGRIVDIEGWEGILRQSVMGILRRLSDLMCRRILQS